MSFNSNGGTGEMTTEYVVAGGTYSLPNCRYNPPANTAFKAWSYNGTEYDAGATFTNVSSNMAFDAVWKSTVTTFTVFYQVVNGTWSDGTATVITENVASGSKPVSVPTGMKASQGFTGGAWNPDPATTTITEATTFTYTFTTTPTYTVTYIANNGTGETKVYNPPATETHKVQGQLFPAPQDKEFNNWLGEDGNTYLEGAQINTNRTLTAQWKDKTQSGGSQGGQNSQGGGSQGGDVVFYGGFGGGDESWSGGYVTGLRAYRVSLAPMQGGSAALVLNTGESGTEMNVYPQTTVRVVPSPAPGYKLASIVWSLIDGSASYDITQAQNLVMPAMDVVVHVTFAPVG